MQPESRCCWCIRRPGTCIELSLDMLLRAMGTVPMMPVLAMFLQATRGDMVGIL
jgi:hypothetical protein